MNSLSDFCSLCFVSNQKLINIILQDEDGIVIVEKLKAFLLELVTFKPNIVKYVCKSCLTTVNFIYKFKIKCLETMTNLNKYLQKLEAQGSSKNIINARNNEIELRNKRECVKENEIEENCCILGNKVVKQEANEHETEKIKTYGNLIDRHNEMEPPEEVFIKTEIEDILVTNDDPLAENIIIKQEHEHILHNFESPYTAEAFNNEHIEEYNNVPSTNTTAILSVNSIKMEESDVENEFLCVSPEVEEVAPKTTLSSLPDKSKDRYLVAYEKFDVWRKERKASIINEQVLLAYFIQKSTVLKSSTLWSEYSMLKATLLVKENLDISRMPQLSAFLKRRAKGYKPNKSRIFDREHIIHFLKEAPDETYLFMKVVLLIGIAGGCRREELKNMTVNDIQDMNSIFIIKIPDSKTKIERIFTISCGSKDEGCDFLQFIRQYAALRPADAIVNRFFLCYKNGKCTKQPVGVNLFGKVPEKIATYLKLPNPCMYTGHCFRRSSATLLLDTEPT